MVTASDRQRRVGQKKRKVGKSKDDGNICSGDGESLIHELHSWGSSTQGHFSSPMFSGGGTENKAIFRS